MLYWLIAISLFLAAYACCFTFSRDVRFFSKLILYGVCVVVGSTIGSIKCIFNGRTTDNHYIIFDCFVKTCSWMQIKIQIENQELLESDEPYVMIANHQAALDVYTMVHVWPKNCVVMLKSSLKYVPGFNLCAWLCCSIFIDRADKTRAHQSVGKCEKAILENKRKIFIYPEGTRNAGTDMLPFKKGAFVIAKNTNVPIVPCVFSSYRSFYSYAERRFDTGVITVRVLPKIYPKDKTVDELANECREVMLKTLKDEDTKKSN